MKLLAPRVAHRVAQFEICEIIRLKNTDNTVFFLFCPQWLTSNLSLPLPPKKYILYQLEQLDRTDNIHIINNYMENLYSDSLHIFDYSDINLQYYNSKYQNKISLLFPPVVNNKLQNDNIQKVYDVLFYGNISQRRNELLLFLNKNGINLKVVNKAFGNNLQELISQSKIVLNVRYSDSKILETCRLNEIIDNKSVYIISEYPENIKDFIDIYKNRILFIEYDKIKILKMIQIILNLYENKRPPVYDTTKIDEITLSNLQILNTYI